MSDDKYSDTEMDRDLDRYSGFVAREKQGGQAEDASHDLLPDLVEAARDELAALTHQVGQLSTEFTTDDARHVGPEYDTEQIPMPTRSGLTGGHLSVRHADGADETLTPTTECVQNFRDQETKLGKMAERMLDLVRASRITHESSVEYLTIGSGATFFNDTDEVVRKDANERFDFAITSGEDLSVIEKGVLDWKQIYRDLHAISDERWQDSVRELDTHLDFLKLQEPSVANPSIISLIDQYHSLLRQPAMPFHRGKGGTSEECQAFFQLVDTEQ